MLGWLRIRDQRNDRNMKILIINSVAGIRSTGRIVTDIAEQFIADGHECIIAYGRENVPEKYKSICYQIGTKLDAYANAIKARVFDNEGLNAKKATKEFIDWADNYDPDVLWLHNLHGYYINIELLFNWIKSRPHMDVRWTLHDCWAFTGHCSYFSVAGCMKWECGCSNCCQKMNYPRSILRDNCAENYERKRAAFCGVKSLTIITPSKWLAELVKSSFLSEYKVKVSHNTIDETIFCPTPSDFRQKYNLTDKKILLGVASVWDYRKGLADFLELSQMLDDSWKIVLVGLTGRQIKSIPKNILGIKRTNSSKELAEIYTAADVFLNLTYEDNYPTVNLEAQACGTPCITYATGGSVESVPQKNIVEQHNLEKVVSLIQELTK